MDPEAGIRMYGRWRDAPLRRVGGALILLADTDPEAVEEALESAVRNGGPLQLWALDVLAEVAGKKGLRSSARLLVRDKIHAADGRVRTSALRAAGADLLRSTLDEKRVGADVSTALLEMLKGKESQRTCSTRCVVVEALVRWYAANAQAPGAAPIAHDLEEQLKTLETDPRLWLRAASCEIRGFARWRQRSKFDEPTKPIR